ncbi:MAG TPA: phage major capsid protein, partial [Candidatus Thalassarchaeaceae archaeon]|nr:phage major capsid protein [Candidatus Thalassarchaeaceae archaeon]
MAGNSSFDEILTTTLKNYVPKLTDNIFSARPLFYALTNGQTIRRVSGGAKIVVPIIYGTNSTAGSYSGTDTIAVTAQTGISAAEYDWGQYAATVTINGMEEAKNNGEAQIIDLLEGKIFQTQETIIENMNTMFWA